jgi:hypothetical protein
MKDSIYRSGTWYLQRSQAGFTGFAFGDSNGILAAPADYYGDGKADIAVFRNGVWYRLQSAAGFSAYQFGLSSDVPIPSSNVPYRIEIRMPASKFGLT